MSPEGRQLPPIVSRPSCAHNKGNPGSVTGANNYGRVPLGSIFCPVCPSAKDVTAAVMRDYEQWVQSTRSERLAYCISLSVTGYLLFVQSGGQQ